MIPFPLQCLLALLLAYADGRLLPHESPPLRSIAFWHDSATNQLPGRPAYGDSGNYLRASALVILLPAHAGSGGLK